MGRSQVVNPTRAVVAGGLARNGWTSATSAAGSGPHRPSTCAGCRGCLSSWPGLSDDVSQRAKEDGHFVSNASLHRWSNAAAPCIIDSWVCLIGCFAACGFAAGHQHRASHQSGRSMLSPACLRPGLFRHKVDRDRKPRAAEADSMSHG